VATPSPRRHRAAALPSSLSCTTFSRSPGSPIAATAYVAAIPGARLFRVPDTTHYVQTERPDVVIAAIKAAVAGSTMTTTPTP